MSHIPLFYRIFFLYIDPLICLSGIYLALFDQPTFLLNGVPSFLTNSTTSTANPLVSHFLYSIGSYSIGILPLQILLLHQFKDAPGGLNVKLWKILEFSILLIDLGLLAGVYVADPEKALDFGSWTSGDWTNNGILDAVVVIRTAFLLNVGGVGRTK